MKVCLVSAMFFEGRKIKVDFRPEVVLETGLRESGLEVITRTHWDAFNPNEFDIVHVHHLGIGALHAACKISRVPFIYTNHDMRAKYGLLSPTKRLASAIVLSAVDTVVALSKSEAEFLGEQYGLSTERIAVIPNGIEQVSFRFLRSNSGGRNSPLRLLYVGQLVPLKGLELLFNALRSVNFDWTLDLVFHTSDILPNLLALAAQLKLTEKINYVGKLASTSIAAAYQKADVLILPSFTEALPSVVTEAMLCGTPVIATDVGGIREQLGGFGLLIEPRSKSSLVRALNILSTQYSRFETQGREMSEYAQHRFSISSMVRSHIDLYPRLSAVGHTRRSLISRWPLDSMTSGSVQAAVAQRKRQCQK